MRIPVHEIRMLSQPPAYRRYAVAVLSALVAVALRFYVGPHLGYQAPFLFAAIAVCVSAQYGGIFPGLVTTALSFTVTYVIFTVPIKGLIPTGSDAAGYLVVLTVGVFLSVFFGRRRQAQEEFRRIYQNLQAAQNIGNVGSWENDLVTNRLWWSAETRKIFGLAEDVPVTIADFFRLVHPEDQERVRELASASKKSKEQYNVEHRIVRDSGEERFVHQIAKVFYGDKGAPMLMIGSIQDITDRKRAEQEIRVLRGLLPICANCKKIRDDKAGGSWSEVETYVKRHSEASFTHGICPTCMEQLYGIRPTDDVRGATN
ncbi:MAG: PAS domain-containing protein [Bryobacteraceae bacterium]